MKRSFRKQKRIHRYCNLKVAWILSLQKVDVTGLLLVKELLQFDCRKRLPPVSNHVLCLTILVVAYTRGSCVFCLLLTDFSPNWTSYFPLVRSLLPLRAKISWNQFHEGSYSSYRLSFFLSFSSIWSRHLLCRILIAYCWSLTTCTRFTPMKTDLPWCLTANRAKVEQPQEWQ